MRGFIGTLIENGRMGDRKSHSLKAKNSGQVPSVAGRASGDAPAGYKLDHRGRRRQTPTPSRDRLRIRDDSRISLGGNPRPDTYAERCRGFCWLLSPSGSCEAGCCCTDSEPPRRQISPQTAKRLGTSSWSQAFLNSPNPSLLGKAAPPIKGAGPQGPREQNRNSILKSSDLP